MNVYNLFLFFITYAFLGWVCETIYVSVGRKELVNRGFLFSPLCPIYGFGALIVLYVLLPFINSPAIIFILGVLATSALEYFVSWLMEMIFHIRWWDYSSYKFNIKGRVCLKNSLLFGVLVLLTVYGINPFISHLIFSFSNNFTVALALVLFAAFLIDTIISTINALNVDKAMTEINKMLDDVQEHGEIAKFYLEKNIEKIVVKLKKREKNFRKAFPHFEHLRSNFNTLNLDELIEKVHLIKKK